MSRNGFKAGRLLFPSCIFLGWILICALGSPEAALSFEVPRLSPVETSIKDRLSLQLVTGSLFSTRFPNGHAHTLDYWQTNLRLGWALNQPGPGRSFFRGDFEALLEVTGSWIYRGSGNTLAGMTALLRYNFVRPGARFFPYAQAGAGIVYTDIYQDESQDAVGQSIEFTPKPAWASVTSFSRIGRWMPRPCSITSPTPTSPTATTGSMPLGGFSG